MLFNQTLTYISLFSGAGVGCYGLLEEGFECVATNEILEKRLNIQRINNKCKFDEGYICGDIKELEIKEKILKRIEFYSKNFGNDRVDLVVATPPCQGMSVANHKKKNDEIKRNSLVIESVDLIKQIKPRFFILENVPSFYKTGCIDKNDNLLEIGSMIEQNLSGDYRLYDEVINFKNFGANSSRTRTLVIGVCKEFKDFTSALEFFPDFKQEKTLKEVIGSLKPLTWGEYDSTDFYHSFRTYPKHMQEWIKDLKEGQSAFENVQDAISDLAYLCSNEGAFESDYLNPIQSSYQALMRKDSPKLYNHQATNHSQAALEKLKLINKEQGKECLPKNLHGKQQFKSTWGRLNWNKISPTIDTRFDTPSNGTNSHPELHRSITPREAARIQSFSDNYIFYGNKTSVCKQIGNAVPPLLALALGKAILKSLSK
ncbi:DNA (cytosine-5-)-methyltransferase [Helicobacter pylori]|uniref:Cytosine-specific methyltransferase n=4 Tax=Helicobacter pylori TaxID=210 RepID=A0A7Z6V1P4_HELPX|nr:DNA cytosine methyltransferase [Helicobacter pylori]EJB31268.1 cytosine-specific methyltransferase [Helicobacter pylori NQ4228]PDW70472.1 DNA (cytosine-5-)-methyltransferase [Helicobacter pylori]PDW72557.1 DNA (cytosine-5-)-methyltransferase [Helicobacter pylori]PDX33689.1 DNA (cytosine-5-)-methyltransferase [Helicobacter pylori]RPF72947.1 DNA cytosine methyltransferase [Helicobacter pylori]